MSMNVQPDREFIQVVKEAGGDTLKQCYQCATCSVACPISPDDSPFPRKEMIYAQWGLKDKLMSDPDVFLCHHCGDCTAMCPRGARPSEVLSAIRAYVYTNLGWPQSLAKMCTSIKNLPMLVGIPALVVFVMWLISGGMQLPGGEHFAKVGYQQFFGHWDFHLLSKNVLFIDIIMLTAVGIAVYSLYRGITLMWKGMASSLDQGGVGYRPGMVQFVKEFLWPSLVEIVQHKRFEECKENHSRVRGHKPLMLAFIGLFFVTIYSMVKNDVFGIFFPSLHGPISMWNPVKWLANVAAVAMIFGIVVLWQNRKKMEAEGTARNTFYDWFYIWIIAAVGVTGLAAELLRIVSIPSLGYIVYYVHLVSVVMLFLYLPYSKFAHIVYRTTAYAFDRYRQSAYVKNPLNE
ncbi:MAG: quinone-interacting membrane-bound oxidoreductase complex subunit QmoC [Desulfobulbaceae bacterium]|nr:quinone-interacting membrane-bound oxidoreductase complex subunit QmoC [Desulfobulbaceae bacterium]